MGKYWKLTRKANMEIGAKRAESSDTTNLKKKARNDLISASARGHPQELSSHATRPRDRPPSLLSSRGSPRRIRVGKLGENSLNRICHAPPPHLAPGVSPRLLLNPFAKLVNNLCKRG